MNHVSGPGVLGRTGLTVGRLGLGCAPLGNLYEPVPEQDAAGTVRAALAGGTRLFDTAPRYGNGVSEQRLGQALAGVPRSEVVVATKVGYLLTDDGAEPDFSYDGTMRCLEESLTRLGLDRVDIAHVHDPDHHEQEALAGAFRALVELREQGVVSAVGAGMNQSAMLERIVARADVDCVLLAGRYTLLDQEALTGLLPACEARGVGVVLGGVYNSGLLADPRPGARYDYRTAEPHQVAAALAIAEICARHGVPMKAAALRFAWGHPAVSALVVGARTADEVRENLAMAQTTVPAGLWAELRAAGLLPQEVPTP
ncbi:aldo/keto reductase [Streptomyces sp. NPDC090052]|uniref:aldo/keto reductase n=1 Tax=unclassified Streptomyces TaxID=2593676 RepID=UPI00224E7F02|nr:MULTISPECIES: aldo/keto reductase [unclassified Streptomyces]MCX4728364.1 aldo/keto reductase [Streptomyces sp. NBC_01306]WSX71553.1 aldo/keto reductase [Streptomyces sp. NBC_00932]